MDPWVMRKGKPFRSVEGEWIARAKAMAADVKAIQDEDLRWAVACLIDSASSGCGILRFEVGPPLGDGRILAEGPNGRRRSVVLAGVHLDGDVGEQVIRDTSEAHLGAAVDWFRARIHGFDLSWICWLFPDVEIAGLRDRYLMGEDGVIWDRVKKKVVIKA